MDDENEQFSIQLPQSELQFNFMTTENTWGSPEVNPELKNSMTEIKYLADENGNIARDDNNEPIILEKKMLWDRFSMYRRDLRLGNLTEDEIAYCRQYLDVAFQCLQMDLYRSSAISLGYVASTIELSQSRRGFLRRLWNTLTHVSVNRTQEPGRKKFLGKPTNNEGM